MNNNNNNKDLKISLNSNISSPPTECDILVSPIVSYENAERRRLGPRVP